MPFLDKNIWHKQLKDALWYWVYIPSAVIGSGLGIDLLFQLPAWPHHILFLAVACALLLLGSGLIWRSTHDLALYGHGTPNPFRPPRELVTKGSYALCRHPMFLGYDLAALGIVLLFRSPAILGVSYPLFLFLQVRFLRQEEKLLAKRFQAAHKQYRQAVPFLIPNPFRWRNHP